jgi:putative protease
MTKQNVSSAKRSSTAPAALPERRLELLAPAGDGDALRAAVAKGADAVYFGLPEFNARRRAANFTLEQLPETVAWLHRHNVRAYVAFNTLIFPSELPRAAEYVAAIARSGADAVIVQDLGLARLIARLAPTLPIHASTQMTLTEPRAIEFVRRLGVTRAILARELSLSDIRAVAAATKVELEAFVHGALCISYSGQCLASCLLFDRSANRGLCAQACRLPYQVLVEGTEHKGEKGSEKPFPLSPRDLASWDLVGEMAAAGVVGFKIEGRQKDAYYVAAATGVYRVALDAAQTGRPFRLSDDQRRDLEQSFSRGFTQGFLGGAKGEELIDGQAPGKAGLRVATVTAVSRRGVVVEMDRAARALKPGDGVVFAAPGADEAAEQGGRIYSVEPYRTPAGPGGGGKTRPSAHRAPLVELTFGRDDLNPAKIAVGTAVWKTDDPQLRRRLAATWSRDVVPRPARVDVEIRAAVGRPLEVTLRDEQGNEAAVASEAPLDLARQHPLDEALVREQFGRLGDTPFALGGVTLSGADGKGWAEAVMAPKSVLNDLRRRAVELLVAAREVRARHEIADPAALEHLRTDLATPAAAEPLPGLQLSVLVRTEEQLAAVIEQRPALVYLDFGDLDSARSGMAEARASGVKVGLAGPRILKPGEEGLLAALLDSRPDAVLVRNLGTLEFFRERAPEVTLVGDFSLNVANELTAAVLLEAGLARITPSLDLPWPELEALLARVPPARVEPIVYQHTALFHLEHCLFSAHSSGGHSRGQCGHPCRRERLRLRDRTGQDHPVVADLACRNTVLSARPQSSEARLPALIAAGIGHLRIEFADETGQATAAALKHFTLQVLPAGA